MASVTSQTPLPTSEVVDVTFDYSSYSDSTDGQPFDFKEPSTPLCINEVKCVTLVVINVIIFLLGILGNGVVIWVVAFKIKKKTVNTTWYLSLALSDFIFCATLPFNITLQATGSWKCGLFMCKFTSFVLFLNMFSSIFLMVIISIDRCVTVVCAVWAQNNRTVRKAAVAVVVAWLFSMLLSIPSLVFRELSDDKSKEVMKCFANYDYLQKKIIFVYRFVLGFVIPLIIITYCYTIIIVRLQNNKMATKSTKPFKVMTALIVTFVISWLPYHIFVLLGINPTQHYETGIAISGTLASANSCMNPFLYAFMGKDVKQKLCSSFTSKIENAFTEDRPSGSRATGGTSISISQL